jgi:hypothetical protein
MCFIVAIFLWLIMLFDILEVKTFSNSKNLLYTKKVCLGELMNYQLVPNVNINKTYDASQNLSHCQWFTIPTS